MRSRLSIGFVATAPRISHKQPEPQRSLVLAICQRTGLNVKFSVDCLEGNGWDLEKAAANFDAVKVRILSLRSFLPRAPRYYFRSW